MPTNSSLYAGVHICEITRVDDILNQNRIKVKLPIFGYQESEWVRPCHGFSSGNGFIFTPKVGDNAIVQFVNLGNGEFDPSELVWLGCTFKSNEHVPLLPNLSTPINPQGTVILKRGNNAIYFNPIDESFSISTPLGEFIITKEIIRIKKGAAKIEIKSEQVTVNGNNLRVLV